MGLLSDKWLQVAPIISSTEVEQRMSSRDPYELVLADLRAKRDDIDSLINTLEAYRTKSEPSTTNVASQARKGGSLFDLSVVEACKLVLRQRGQPLSSDDIAKELMAGGHMMTLSHAADSITSVLDRALQKDEGIVRIGQGPWALVEWTRKGRSEKPLRSIVMSNLDDNVTNLDDRFYVSGGT